MVWNYRCFKIYIYYLYFDNIRTFDDNVYIYVYVCNIYMYIHRLFLCSSDGDKYKKS